MIEAEIERVKNVNHNHTSINKFVVAAQKLHISTHRRALSIFLYTWYRGAISGMDVLFFAIPFFAFRSLLENMIT